MLCTARSRYDQSSGSCSAAAAIDLNPAPKIVPPHVSYNRDTIMEARNRKGGSNLRAELEWYFARVDVARIRLAVLEVCASKRELQARRHGKNFRGHIADRQIRPPKLRSRAPPLNLPRTP
jgi:hypothetical protein